MSLPIAVCELETTEMMGVRLPLDPSVMSPLILKTLRAGEYERGEAKNLPNLLEPGERLLELGGGIGFLSALAGIQGKTEAITVVEANPALIPLIHATHALNGVEATVINGAVVGERRSETTSFCVAEDFWASSLSPRKSHALSHRVEVPTIAVMDLVREHRPTMMIIDVEGGETDLFPALQLDGVRLVVMELHEKVIRRAGVKTVFDGLAGQGLYYNTHFSMKGVVVFTRAP
jgi:FkbM family methyltransferase